MVAIQRVEYTSQGDIAPPRKELQKLRRELNGEFTASADHWHCHTVASDDEKSFDRAVASMKQNLAKIGAEVFQVERSGPTVVDVFYLVEDPQRTLQILRDVSNGNHPAELSLNDLSPAR